MFALSGKGFLVFLALGTITTGCLNSIFTKYQDNQCVKNCANPDLSTHKNFEQPVLQSLQMFIGEMLCFLTYYFVYVRKSTQNNGDYQPIADPTPTKRSRRDWLLAIPAACDLCGTTLMNLGLLYTPVSIYQMTRGSVVLFVAIFSVVFLKRKISRVEWLSLIIVVLGVGIVGISGSSKSSEPSEDSSSNADSLIVLGIFLILLAQLFTASQFVVEEHMLYNSNMIPLKVVGLEGFFGASILFVAMLFLHLAVGITMNGRNGPFDMINAFQEMFSSWAVLGSSLLIMCSIASFNFFGLSITDKLSATSRSTIDTCRTLLVWLISMILGWESFKLLQFAGFILLVFGTLSFNGAIDLNQSTWVPNWLKTPVDQPRVISVADNEQIERM